MLIRLNESNAEVWNKFLEKEPLKYPQSSLMFKESICNAYGNCTSYYLLYLKDRKFMGLLPLIYIKSKVFGNKVISLPFIDFGGPIGEFSEEFVEELIEYVENNLKEISYIELRLNNFSESYNEVEERLLEKGFVKEEKKNQFILKLESEEGLWKNFDRITRKGINKANKSGLALKEIDDEKELKNFYNLYKKNMKYFGSPHHSFKFFRNLMESEDFFKGLNCYKDDKLIGSLIALYSNDYTYAAYAASDKEYLTLQPNDLLYWEMIKWSIKNGKKYFDLGQCDSGSNEGTHASGIYRFKKKWGGKIYNKTYFYHYINNKKLKKEISKNKEKLSKVWKKLPKVTTNVLGPRIVSQLGT